MKSDKELLEMNCANDIYDLVLRNEGYIEEQQFIDEADYYNEFYENNQDFIDTIKLCFRLLANEIPVYKPEGMIELSNNRTDWEFDEFPEGIDYNSFAYEKDFLLKQAMDMFERDTGVKVGLYGRMGRHVCVDNTIENLYNYDELCKVQRNLEKWYIEQINDYLKTIGGEEVL